MTQHRAFSGGGALRHVVLIGAPLWTKCVFGFASVFTSRYVSFEGRAFLEGSRGGAWYKDFDIIFDHASRRSEPCTAPSRAVGHALRGHHAYWIPIGACDPMS